MGEELQRYQLGNRYVFTGHLVMQTAFHIGGGRLTLSSSDSPVVLTPDGRPFIPGSSFKGSLRSTTEKIVPALPASAELSTCALIELSKEEKEAAKKEGRFVCSSLRQREIAAAHRANPRDATVYTEARKGLCSTCKLFGSPFTASHLSIEDLYLADLAWEDGLIQRRDGVAIDRDSEKARDRLKYDFEVVPATTAFQFHMTLENASAQDLQLISIGLSEFVNGHGTIGGMRSRGLGACTLNDLKVTKVDLENASPDKDRYEMLKNYLLNKEPVPIDGKKFLECQIGLLFGEKPQQGQ